MKFLNSIIFATLIFISLNVVAQGQLLPNNNQIAEAQTKFHAPAGNDNLSNLVESSRERAVALMLAQSCYKGSEFGKFIKRWVDPDINTSLLFNNLYKFNAPMADWQYHDNHQCASVARIDDFKLLAKNAYSFRITYESPTSGESSVFKIELVRAADGEWLVRLAAHISN